MIATLDLLLRGAGLGAVLVVIVLLARHYGATVAGRLGIGFGVAVVASLFCPLLANTWQVGAWGLPAYLGCFAAPGLFWLFVRAWFDDGFRPRWPHALAVAALVGLHVWRFGVACVVDCGPSVATSELAGILNALPFLVDLGVILSALLQARAGRANDLDEARRRFRDFMVNAIGGYMVLVAGLGIYLFYRRPAPLIDLLLLLGAVALIFAFLLLSARMPPRLFGGAKPAPAPGPGNGQAEEQLQAALTRFMVESGGYRRPGLTVTGLAETLGVPEYRLRRLINGRMGHRNFSDFVNGYRLAQAYARLADPALARTPVLTIALDAGFQSIGPFNRAFKDATGMTPLEFRRAKLGGTAPG